ncbi:uncharacterized protein LOC106865801 [Brachypodium distachyon]|uniref:DUF1618 domain-containing protein n=1 Tax=Brachypodium distachyon TaxID=15368 RepID=I1H155_BRADI|nr:uncharacterized protein LOC106865801 [Brachypodium distachyon]KQK19661.1 hypothetical protein BRADI_1g49640v3 [Brachypodium distachyon]PNT76566.1 hypothetical protein BRADI_1g49640v3 [Brachypodium distachyon]|eukprot:XP_014752103.1 uncharacterized protein LOC106865801 [Brachypodium distachyon]
MPKRQSTPEPCGHNITAKRRQQTRRQRHLYLVVDDWERGYSVRKIDLESSSDLQAADPEPEPLPEPPVVRFEGKHCHLQLFGVHGTKILAMPAYGAADFPIYDTQTTAITLCAHPDNLRSTFPVILASIDGALHMIRGSCLFVLDAPPPPAAYHRAGDQPWTWTTKLSDLPFATPHLKSFALHPDGRTLFVSARRGTFSVDAQSLRSTRHGGWSLPFQGEALFDKALNAWVGLCAYEGGVGNLCSCDVVEAECRTMPAWKLGKDRLFCAGDKKRRHLGAKLLAMGGDGESSDYCLVESAVHEDEEPAGTRHRVFHVTVFGLEYDEDGALRTTTRRRAGSYEMRVAHDHTDRLRSPAAFSL